MIRMFIPILFLSACQTDKYSGYVVCKEFIPEHECHSEVRTVRESIIIVPPKVPSHHQHKTQEARYIVYIANKDFVRSIDTDKTNYQNLKITDKVKVENNKITKEY